MPILEWDFLALYPSSEVLRLVVQGDFGAFRISGKPVGCGESGYAAADNRGVVRRGPKGTPLYVAGDGQWWPYPIEWTA